MQADVRMLNNPAFVAYARSLIWVGLLIAISLSVLNIVALVLFDFIHGNPHRTHENALTMMVVFPPFFVIVALIGVILIFGLTQCLQAVVADFLMRRFGRLAQFAIILALPATTVLAWYCYEYLTPTDFYLGGRPEGWRPYQHGLTQTRYLVMLIAQTLVTLFSPALQRCLVAQ